MFTIFTILSAEDVSLQLIIFSRVEYKETGTKNGKNYFQSQIINFD